MTFFFIYITVSCSCLPHVLGLPYPPLFFWISPSTERDLFAFQSCLFFFLYSYLYKILYHLGPLHPASCLHLIFLLPMSLIWLLIDSFISGICLALFHNLSFHVEVTLSYCCYLMDFSWDLTLFHQFILWFVWVQQTMNYGILKTFFWDSSCPNQPRRCCSRYFLITFSTSPVCFQHLPCLMFPTGYLFITFFCFFCVFHFMMVFWKCSWGKKETRTETITWKTLS